MSDHQERPSADVELRLPADGVYVSVVRTTTAGLAARLDFLIDDMTVEVAVSASSPEGPEYDSFAWQVLSTMATEAEADASGGRFAVRLTMESGVPGAGS